MIRVSHWIRAVALCVTLGAAARADMLVLKDGRVVEGRFVAGSESFIQFRTESGIESFPLDIVSSIHLKSDGDTTLSHTAGASGAARSPTSETALLPAGAVLVPAGTTLWLRFDSEISSSSEDAGDSFDAKLDSDLVADGRLAAARGSVVRGQIAEVRGGKKLGAQYLKVKLLNLTVGNRKIPLVTANFGVERSSGDVPKLIGAEQAAPAGSESDPDMFAEDKDHVRIPKGTVFGVPLREPVALYP